MIALCLLGEGPLAGRVDAARLLKPVIVTLLTVTFIENADYIYCYALCLVI
jgi:hypothetical protein